MMTRKEKKPCTSNQESQVVMYEVENLSLEWKAGEMADYDEITVVERQCKLKLIGEVQTCNMIS